MKPSRRNRSAWALVSAVLLAAACTNPNEDDTHPPGDGGSDSHGHDVLPCSSLSDTDGDTIADQYEGMTVDTDGDTIPNYMDADSDGDTLTDAEEAGTGGSYCGYPRDSDGDDIIDALDVDSDNDGLSDGDERGRWGTDPLNPDTDGDTVTDLGEVAYGDSDGDTILDSNPLDRSSTFDPEDFFVILPYTEPEQVRQLTFGTNLQVADVYFLMDSTGSMSSAINNVITSLSETIVPGLAETIPDVGMGVGALNDFPSGGYGDCGTDCDSPYWHDQDILPVAGPGDPNVAVVQDALQTVLSRPRGVGGDSPESYAVAIYLTATGEGLDTGGAVIPPKECPSSPDEPRLRSGYPCFRPGALPIVVLVGDAPWHNGPAAYSPYSFWAPAYNEALSTMLAIGARFIGVYVDHYMPEGQAHQEQMARDTGTVDADGNPLVSVSADGTVSTDIVDMIGTLARFTPQDVTTTTENDPLNPYSVDARGFITAITPLTSMPAPPEGCVDWDATTFHMVQPGTQVTFNVTFYNSIFPPRDSATVFRATIVVLGNSVARLDERLVIIIVPPTGAWVWFG
jgi:hypothetical protein